MIRGPCFYMKDLVHKGPYLLNIHYDLYMKHIVESSSDPSSWAFNKSHMILVADLVYKIVGDCSISQTLQ